MAKGHRSSSVVLLVVAAAAGLWSCGGSVDGPTSPVLQEGPALAAAVPGGGDEGEVTASCRKVTICHKGQNLSVTKGEVDRHLRHGDRLGSCTAAVACPCFTATGIAQLAGQCTGTPVNSCPTQYSISLVCVGSGGGSTGPLGSFQATVGAGTCSTKLKDATGAFVTTVLPVTPVEYDACKQAIVGSAVYPVTCPQ
jgi:hypothetical protein